MPAPDPGDPRRRERAGEELDRLREDGRRVLRPHEQHGTVDPPQLLERHVEEAAAELGRDRGTVPDEEILEQRRRLLPPLVAEHLPEHELPHGADVLRRRGLDALAELPEPAPPAVREGLARLEHCKRADALRTAKRKLDRSSRR